MNKFGVLGALFLTLASGSAVSAGKTNFLEVFAKSNDFSCVELNIDGIAVHVRVRFGGIDFFASAVISHYTPDFLVTAYPRLGDSPLLESYAALGTAQNIVSKPFVEFLSGVDAPETYGVRDEWGGGKGSDSSDKQNKTLAYYEAEVFGHPGNVFSWASRATRGETVLDAGIATDFVTAIPSQAAEIPGRFTDSLEDVQDNAGTTLGEGFSLDALSRIDPVELATNAFVGELTDFVTNSGIGQAVSLADSLIPDDIQDDLVGNIISNTGLGLQGAASDVAIENGGEGTEPPVVVGAGQQEPDSQFDLSGLDDVVVDRLQEELGNLTPEAIGQRVQGEIADLMAEVQEVTELFNTLKGFVNSETLLQAVPGVTATFLEFNGLCPSDVDPFFPYYLSGTNVLSWRYKIPEIIYPQTYIPFSNSTTIGTLLPGEAAELASDPLSTLAEIQNYGSVYPRNGYMLQSHPLKAAAVAAFRATHIVTRPNQPHIYRHPKPREHREFLQLDPGYDEFSGGDDDRDDRNTYLQPDVAETGRWHLVHNEGGEEDEECHRFGAPETNEPINTDNPIKLIGDVANRFTEQWADDKASEDNSYVFSMWRRYRCAHKPQGSGGFFGSNVFHVFNLEFPSPIEILH